jgi:hypothetical protein
MTQISNSGKFLPGSARSRRALPCLVPGTRCRIAAWVSSCQKICRKRRSFDEAVRIGTAGGPGCGKRGGRDRVCTRVLHDVGDLVCARPRDIHRVYAQSHGSRGRKSFTAAMSDSAVPKAPHPPRVVSLAVRLVVEEGLPSQAASGPLWHAHRVFVPFATLHHWVEAGGKKAARQM